MDPIPPQKSNLESVSISLPENLTEQFQEAAQQDGLSENEFAIQAIKRGFLELQELDELSAP
jgi:metal-responsive CopG/Arc/MetJ family transcriptional regulator